MDCTFMDGQLSSGESGGCYHTIIYHCDSSIQLAYNRSRGFYVLYIFNTYSDLGATRWIDEMKIVDVEGTPSDALLSLG